MSSPGTCYANRQGPTHNGSRQPAGQPAPPPPPPHPIVLPSAGAVGAPEQDPGFSPGQEGLLGWLGMPERMSDCADEMPRGVGGPDPPEREIWALPHPSPPLPRVRAEPTAPPWERPWLERAAHRPWPCAFSSFLWVPSLVGVPPGTWLSTAWPLPPRTANAQPQWCSWLLPRSEWEREGPTWSRVLGPAALFDE